jgi:hypothetical protein
MFLFIDVSQTVAVPARVGARLIKEMAVEGACAMNVSARSLPRRRWRTIWSGTAVTGVTHGDGVRGASSAGGGRAGTDRL